jgi:hypothetical protein
MALDSGWPNVTPQNPNAPPGAQRFERPARSLGRGFEEISHLFLSDSAAARPGERTGADARERGPLPPGIRTGVPVLRRGAPLTRDQLTATLRDSQNALEADLRAIGSSVACQAYGEIDLLALDRAHRLTIVDVETRPGDGLLLRGLSHVDWVRQNVSNIQRMYPDVMIDATRPRLCLVAPAFSPVLRGALRQIVGPDITCFRYHEVGVLGETGIFVERCGCEDD